MQDLHPELSQRLEKAIESLTSSVTPLDDTRLTAEETLRAHFLVADYFLKRGEGIGGVGPKSIALLESAVSRQWVGFGGHSKWGSLYERAATAMFGLICNHPFHDANKRTALLSTVHLLRKNNVAFVGEVDDLEELVVRVAEHTLDQYPGFQQFADQDGTDPEVRFIASFLKAKCRRIDRSHKTLTYRQLDAIVKEFGFYLDEPKGNRISVFKIEHVTTGFFRKRQEPRDQKICRIDFPGWTKQAAKKDIEFLRKKLRLNEHAGVDAAALFQQGDDMRDLIKLYEGALTRLAYR